MLGYSTDDEITSHKKKNRAMDLNAIALIVRKAIAIIRNEPLGVWHILAFFVPSAIFGYWYFFILGGHVVFWTGTSSLYHPSDALEAYCTAGPHGQEGHFPTSNVMKLRHVVLNIRHGDRSSLYGIPGLVRKYKSTGINSKDTKEIQYVKNFDLETLDNYDHVFLDPFNVTRLNGLATLPEMPPGLLTTVGFEQHLQLGAALRRRYGAFFAKIRSPDQIFVRSTNFERTFQVRSSFII
jgi:hypothetical protein